MVGGLIHHHEISRFYKELCQRDTGPLTTRKDTYRFINLISRKKKGPAYASHKTDALIGNNLIDLLDY